MTQGYNAAGDAAVKMCQFFDNLPIAWLRLPLPETKDSARFTALIDETFA